MIVRHYGGSAPSVELGHQLRNQRAQIYQRGFVDEGKDSTGQIITGLARRKPIARFERT